MGFKRIMLGLYFSALSRLLFPVKRRVDVGPAHDEKAVHAAQKPAYIVPGNGQRQHNRDAARICHGLQIAVSQCNRALFMSGVTPISGFLFIFDFLISRSYGQILPSL